MQFKYKLHISGDSFCLPAVLLEWMPLKRFESEQSGLVLSYSLEKSKGNFK
jgi:hypothetical protein